MIDVRYATSKDVDLIVALGRETFYQKWRPVNTEEDMQAYLAKAFNKDTILMDLENQANIFLLAYFKQQPVAYVKMRNDRTYPEFNNDKVLEIERIYVLEQYQNNKIGCSLMDECIAIAKRDNYKWLWLGVNIDNHQAINFYKKYQFTVFGTKQFQLGNAVDDDYLMKLEVKV